VTRREKRLNRIRVTRYVATKKGKKTRRDYQAGPGKKSHQMASRKYKASAKGRRNYRHYLAYCKDTTDGQITRRLWNKDLPQKEQDKARKAWKSFSNRCQCCGSISHNGKGWCLDHKDKKFRGIICSPCNLAAGLLKDSIRRCLRLINYLRRTKCRR
jgi:hypothetical protein